MSNSMIKSIDKERVPVIDIKKINSASNKIDIAKELYKSFFSIKSPNNIKYRYRLFKKFFGKVGAFFVTASISLNTIVKFIIRKI